MKNSCETKSLVLNHLGFIYDVKCVFAEVVYIMQVSFKIWETEKNIAFKSTIENHSLDQYQSIRFLPKNYCLKHQNDKLNI